MRVSYDSQFSGVKAASLPATTFLGFSQRTISAGAGTRCPQSGDKHP